MFLNWLVSIMKVFFRNALLKQLILVSEIVSGLFGWSSCIDITVSPLFKIYCKFVLKHKDQFTLVEIFKGVTISLIGIQKIRWVTRPVKNEAMKKNKLRFSLLSAKQPVMILKGAARAVLIPNMMEISREDIRNTFMKTIKNGFSVPTAVGIIGLTIVF